MARSDGNYLVIRGYVDGTIQGERSFDTQQEAEYYGKQMLAYIKKMNPKAKKVTVDIDSMTNHSPGPKIKTLASRHGAKARFKVEDRFYFGKGRKERFWARGYDNAKDRVRRSSELGKYAKIIMQPEFDSADHWDWVSTASIGEIVNWAKSIARDI